MGTREDFINETKMDLGYPTVKVELDDTVWDALFSKTLRWFKAHKGLIATTTIPLVDGTISYDWPAEAYAITDVILPRRSDISDILSLGFFDLVPASYVIGGSSLPSGMRVDVSNYVQLLQSLEMRRRVFSSDPDWFVQDYPEKKIIITVNPTNIVYSYGGSALHMIVRYKKTTLDIPDLLGRDEEYAYRYFLAKSKIVLGAIRSKYSTYPTAGGSVTMDGEALKNEGFAEIERLEVELIDSQGNAGGILIG